jgi:hypothetical protein
MITAEQFPNVVGSQRKNMILQAVTLYLEKTNGDSELVNLLPPFIDAAVDLEKGNTKIAAEEAITGCIGCLSFLSLKLNKKNKTKKIKQKK